MKKLELEEDPYVQLSQEKYFKARFRYGGSYHNEGEGSSSSFRIWTTNLNGIDFTQRGVCKSIRGLLSKLNSFRNETD